MKQGLIKTGLMSFGMSGRVFHAPFISVHPQFELTAISERSKNLSATLYPDARIVRSISELLAQDDIELVVVNTPDPTHYEYAKMALEAGKHVIVEKPFTLTTAEGRELIESARSRGLMLCVYQNRRWDADFLTVREILEDGLLGRLVEYEAVYARYRREIVPDTWKEQEGGLTYNLGSHIIDQCVSLFGCPEAVFADIATMRDGGRVDDYFILHLLRCSLAPDLRITLKAGYLMRRQEPRFVLHGTNGSYVKYGVDPQEDMLKAGAIPLGENWGLEAKSEWGTLVNDTFNGRYPSVQGHYAWFYEAVYKCLRKDTPHPTDASNVLPVISIIEAAKLSSETGQVIHLNPHK
ncbi:MAG: Gfo/Idh/MocA family oxidoreductase [Tannerella sp.]|nr:Gfo/Idh/MocA family oxidoreductase [Tannerella sp.]